jgi:hypothetical protein
MSTYIHTYIVFYMSNVVMFTFMYPGIEHVTFEKR